MAEIFVLTFDLTSAGGNKGFLDLLIIGIHRSYGVESYVIARVKTINISEIDVIFRLILLSLERQWRRIVEWVWG